MSLAEILGQSEAVRVIRQGWVSGKLHHALLIDGPRGVGKTLLARKTAELLLCDTPLDEVDRCGQCRGCRLAAGGNHPDLMWIEPVEGKKTISVAQIREVRRRVEYPPHQATARAVVIDGAARMSVEAQNALLKTLEEPASRTHLLLTTSRAAQLLQTVRSRCGRVRLLPLGEDHVATVLRQLRPEATNLEMVAQLARGSVSTALVLADEDLEGLVGTVRRVDKALEAHNTVDLLDVATDLASAKETLIPALELLALWNRDVVVAASDSTSSVGLAFRSYADDIEATASQIDVDRATSRLRVVLEGIELITRRNANGGGGGGGGGAGGGPNGGGGNRSRRRRGRRRPNKSAEGNRAEGNPRQSGGGDGRDGGGGAKDSQPSSKRPPRSRRRRGSGGGGKPQEQKGRGERTPRVPDGRPARESRDQDGKAVKEGQSRRNRSRRRRRRPQDGPAKGREEQQGQGPRAREPHAREPRAREPRRSTARDVPDGMVLLKPRPVEAYFLKPRSYDPAGLAADEPTYSWPEGERLFNVVAVRYSTGRRVEEFDASDSSYERDEEVVVETDKGLQLGVVTVGSRRQMRRGGKLPRVIRRMNPNDSRQRDRNQSKEAEALEVCAKLVREHRLSMKLISVDYLHGGNRAVFYFEAEGRVDFRQLVRELASLLHTRIEMRQVGVRDASRFTGGIGPCGLQLCCNSFLQRFAPVSIRMAKDQNLVLNPQKVSGVCGRLMCCLTYEQEGYQELRKGLPKVGKRIQLKQGGAARVREVDVLRRRVRVLLEDGTNIDVTPDEILPPSRDGGRPPQAERQPPPPEKGSGRRRKERGGDAPAEQAPDRRRAEPVLNETPSDEPVSEAKAPADELALKAKAPADEPASEAEAPADEPASEAEAPVVEDSKPVEPGDTKS